MLLPVETNTKNNIYKTDYQITNLGRLKHAQVQNRIYRAHEMLLPNQFAGCFTEKQPF